MDLEPAVGRILIFVVRAGYRAEHDTSRLIRCGRGTESAFNRRACRGAARRTPFDTQHVIGAGRKAGQCELTREIFLRVYSNPGRRRPRLCVCLPVDDTRLAGRADDGTLDGLYRGSLRIDDDRRPVVRMEASRRCRLKILHIGSAIEKFGHRPVA